MHPEVVDREEKLSHLFNEAKTLEQYKNIDNELKVQFVWYLCIRTSGFVEFSVRTILSEYFESNTENQQLGDYVSIYFLASRQ